MSKAIHSPSGRFRPASTPQRPEEREGRCKPASPSIPSVSRDDYLIKVMVPLWTQVLEAPRARTRYM